jgi:hypothetical protein
MNTFLERFVNEIRLLDKTSRFIPEKILTLSSISINILHINADIFKYLIDNKIWVIGNASKLTSFKYHKVIAHLRSLSWAYRNHKRFHEVIKDYELNLDLLTDPVKFSTVLFYNEFQNINIITDELIEKAKNNRAENIIINLEKITGKCQISAKDLQTDMVKEFETRLTSDSYNDLLEIRRENGLEKGLEQKDVKKINKEMVAGYIILNQKINNFLYSEQPPLPTIPEKEDIFDPSGKSFSAS